MKVRDINLMATGAIVTIAVIVGTTTNLYTPKAQAQAAAPAPAGVSMIVSGGNAIYDNSTSQCGTIVLQDTVNRKVTVVAYDADYVGGLSLSAPQSYGY
jgi:hypothetical protein